MKRGDYLLATFDGDTNDPPIIYAAEILLVDAVAETFECRLTETGLELSVRYRSASSGVWEASGSDGATYGLATHDVYSLVDAGPGVGDVALLSFADGERFLCFVESMDPTTTVQIYDAPYAMFSLELGELIATDWDRYAVGETGISLQRCERTNDMPAPVLFGVFSGGWWSLAERRDAHAGRVGAVIAPYAIVVHTTDMTPNTWNGLINRWQTQPGNGACAHFAIGRSAAQGVVQLVPIDRNANHAGGDGHGSFVSGNQRDHPNNVSVGIEIHCAGAVRLIDGTWRLIVDGVPQPEAIPAVDVIEDPARPGRGWHKVTEYQYEQLAALIEGLEAALEPMPEGCVAEALHPVPQYGRFASGRLVGHVSLSPHRRGDPWPPTCDWMRAL